MKRLQDHNETNVIQALGCTKEPWLLKRFLDHFLKDNYPQWLFRLGLSNIVKHEIGKPLVWNFIQENWAFLKARNEEIMLELSIVFLRLTYDLSSNFQFDQMINFLKSNANQAEEFKTIAELKDVRKRILKFKDKSLDSVCKWLKENVDRDYFI
ncbi:aminopeptidase N-like [Amia ocellicauda]|uniref:aminopeptidase N-like n=1 Tax=Amia ocellicauda TaxID=2972642 RepID=UPI003463D232